MKKRIISLVLALCLVLALLPAQAFAAEDNSLTLPVMEEVEEEEAAPAPESAVKVTYVYKGLDAFYVSYVDFTAQTAPEDNGIFQLLDSSGKAVASSEASSYYWYDNLQVYRSHGVDFENTSSLPVGTYSVQLVAGNTEYPCLAQLRVVDGPVVDSARIQKLYIGCSSFEVNMGLYGFETEEDLSKLSFQLLDGSGTVVAKSTGAYRVASFNSDGRWGMYAQMNVLTGKTISSGAPYSLKINYSGTETLYNNADTVSQSAFTASVAVNALEIIDAQTARVAVTLANWDKDSEYLVCVYDDYSDDAVACGVYSGTIPSNGVVCIDLTTNGAVLPMTEYDYQLFVKVCEAEYPDNPIVITDFINYYANLSNENYNVSPSHVKTTAKSVELEIGYYSGGCSAYTGSGDVISLRDTSGNEVGRCTSVTEVRENANSGYLKGTVQITGTLTARTHYYVYLNGVMMDSIYAASALATSSRVPMYNGSQFWSNLGEFPVRVDALNAASGRATFVFRNSAGQDVLSSGQVAAKDSEYQDYVRYEYSFDLSSLTPGEAYSLYFRDSGGTEATLMNSCVYYATKSEITFSNRQCSIQWYSLEEGDTEMGIYLFLYNYNGLNNVTEEELQAAVKRLSISNGVDSITVTGLEYEWDGYDSLTGVLKLSGAVSAGDYTAYLDGTQLRTFSVSANEENTAPYIYSADEKLGCIRGGNLDPDAVYTGKLFQGYTCLTDKAFALTYTTYEGDSGEYLYFEKGILSDLEAGKYQIWVFADGKLLDQSLLSIVGELQPLVRVEDDNWEIDGGPVINTQEVYISVENIGAYGFIRWAEDKTALSKRSFVSCMSNRSYRHEFESTEEGARTLFVELSKTGTAGDTDNLLVEMDLWMCTDGDYNVQVPEDVYGLQNPEDEVYLITATTDVPYTKLWVSFYDAEGGHASRQMEPVGQLADGRWQFALEVGTGDYDYFYDDESYGGAFYYKNTQSIRVFATDLGNVYNDGESYRGNVVGQAVERPLFFGDPTKVILTQFLLGNVVTNTPAYVLTGYATPNSTVWLTIKHSSEQEVTMELTADASGYFSECLSLWGEGVYTIFAEDSEGLTSEEKVYLTVDITAPVISNMAFTFLDNGAAVLRWMCEDDDVEYFSVYKNSTYLGRVYPNSNDSYSYNIAAEADDGNTFTIVAIDEAGNEARKTVSTADAEPPTAPGEITVGTVTTTTVPLSWTAGADNLGVAGYNIYINDVLVQQTTGAEVLSATLTGLEQGTDYTVSVKTRDKAGNLSDAVAVKTATVKLVLDSSALANGYVVDKYADKEIPLSFSVTAEGYTPELRSGRLEYRAKGEETWYSEVFDLAGNRASGEWDVSGNDDGYLAMGEYEVRFRAEDTEGAVVTTEPIPVVLLKRDDEAPSVPGVPTADSHSTVSITFSWTASIDNVAVDHYEIWRDGVLVAVSESAGYTDSQLEMGKSYSYSIKAVDARGNTSDASEAAVLSTMTLEFDSVITLESSYLMEAQRNKLIAVWAKFKPQEGYDPEITMALEFMRVGDSRWTVVPLTVNKADTNFFEGDWNLDGDDTGYLKNGTYTVRFSVTDGQATAYSQEQTVELLRDTEAPEITGLLPSGGTFRGKDVSLSGSATDNVAVVKMGFFYAVDGSDEFILIGEGESSGSYSFVWDAEDLPSGLYRLKVCAEDLRGNKGEKVVAVTLDNDPPAVPGSPMVLGTSRYIYVGWTFTNEADFDHFNVYRATAEDGLFECIKSLKTLGYYDDGETADADTVYYYKVTSVDKYGNESKAAVAGSAKLVADDESPAITDMRPLDGASLRKSTTLRVIANDNYRLSKVVFYYRPAGSGNWTLIGEKETDKITNNCELSYAWVIPSELDGEYEIKAEVYDDSINDVDENSGYSANDPGVWISTVTIHAYTAPVAPSVDIDAGYKKAELSWNYSGDEATLSGFDIYKCNSDGSGRTYVAGVSKKSDSCTVTIPRSGTVYFVVVARNIYGATATSDVVSVTSLPKETEPPVAVIQPETLTGAMGIAIPFSAVNSTDNDVIAGYEWSFGDGTTGSGVQCSHTYEEAGTYTVRLTVTDESGNQNTAEGTITVYDVTAEDAAYALMTLSVVNGYASGTPAVKGAEVKIYNEEGFETTATADQNGRVVLVVPVGTCTVSVTANGYLATSRSVIVEGDESGNFAYTVGLTPMNVSMVDGSLSVKEMTYEEIVAAGIDTDHPDNNHVWKFSVELEFVAGPSFPFDLPSLPVTGYYNNTGSFLGGSGWGWLTLGGGGGGGSGGGWGGMRVGVFPISESFILVIYGEAHWLKEMYNVELLVINNSYTDAITDCEATLELPEGLSLAAMSGAAQSEQIKIGTIQPKSDANADANTAKVNWYVRGDVEGEYNLTATVTGRNPEPFVKTFTTDKPVKVYAGTALHLSITAQDMAFSGEEYHVRFELTNVSHKDLYNLSFGITGTEQFKVIRIGEKEGRLELNHQDFDNGATQKIDKMEPGDSIIIDFYTTTWFNSIAELTGFGPFDVGYYLTNTFVTTLEGSTTSIPYDINIEHVSHGTIFEYIGDKLEEGVVDTVIDVIDKELFDEVPMVGTLVKVVKFVTTDTGDSASRVEISLKNGSFTSGGNSMGVRGANSGAVLVYTDAEEGSYEISEDGSTMIITGPANIYVQGNEKGEAVVTFTTYYHDTVSDSFQPSKYEMTYKVSDEMGVAESILLEEPEQTTAAVPYAGEVAQIVFPYALFDKDGYRHTAATNAVWTVTGENTAGLSVDKGVLYIDSIAAAGEYTVTLSIEGGESVSQTVTLTREESAPASVVIYRGGEQLIGTDSLRLPTGDQPNTVVYTAQLLDQYGMPLEAVFAWSVPEENGVAAVEQDGTVALLAVGQVLITAEAEGVSGSVLLDVLTPNITLSQTEAELLQGKTLTLKATVINLTNKKVTWSSSDPTVATVSSSGKITPKAAGTVIITATASDGSTASCTVTVVPVLTVLLLTVDGETVKNLTVGKLTAEAELSEVVIRLMGKDKNGDLMELDDPASAVWTSSSLAVADIVPVELPGDGEEESVLVADSMRFNLLSTGSSTIKVVYRTAEGKSLSISLKLTVTQMPVGLVITNSEGAAIDSAQVAAGKSLTLKVLFTPENTTNQSVVWTSSSEYVTVSKGKITAAKNAPISTGEEDYILITATSVADGSIVAECRVYVKEYHNSIALYGEEDLTRKLTALTMGLGELDEEGNPVVIAQTVVIPVVLNPNGGQIADHGIVWSSSDETVAVVTEEMTEDDEPVPTGRYVITAYRAGKVTLTATTAQGKAVKLTVTVNQLPTDIEVTLPEGIEVNDSGEILLGQGKTLTLKAVAGPDDAKDKKLVWETSDKTIATVSGGKVTVVKTAPADSTVVITVYAGANPDVRREFIIRVTPVAKGLSVFVDGEAMTAYTWAIKEIGESAKLVLEAGLTDLAGGSMGMVDAAWTSANTKVATVDASTGEVTAVAAGSAKITAEYDGKKVTLTLKIEQAPVALTLSQTVAEIAQGKTLTLKPVFDPESTANKGVIWSSDNEAVTVSGGKITVTKNAQPGSVVTITATSEVDPSVTAVCTVTVVSADEYHNSIGIYNEAGKKITSLAINKGVAEGTAQLTAVVLNSAGEEVAEAGIVWASDSEDIIVIDGIVVAYAAGKANITATTAQGKVAKVTVTVTQVPYETAVFCPDGLDYEDGHILLGQGKSVTLKGEAGPEDAKDKTLVWAIHSIVNADGSEVEASAYKRYATVSGGKITVAKTAKAGSIVTFKVYPKANPDEYATVFFTVKVAPVRKGLAIVDEENNVVTKYSVAVGEALNLRAAYVDLAGDWMEDVDAQWTSAKQTVATVEDGVVTAEAKGSAKITAKVITEEGRTLSAYCTVSVAVAPN